GASHSRRAGIRPRNRVWEAQSGVKICQLRPKKLCFGVSYQGVMKMKFCKIPTLILAGAILFFTYAAGLRAQQAGPKPAATVITTNWAGYLVGATHDEVYRRRCVWWVAPR